MTECHIMTTIKIFLHSNFHILGCITIALLIYASVFVGLLGFDASYSFYLILRWFVTIFSLYCAIKVYKINPKSRWLSIALIAVLFNPITMISLKKTTWQIIDFITLLLFIKVWALKK